MKKLVVSTGAGISAESGLSTFRDAGGLWDKYPVMDVASHDGFVRNPALVHEFYNKRRRELLTVAPNAAHTGLKELEKLFDVRIITQNVDDLHERAGSSHVLHLHGELMKVRSMRREDRVYTLAPDNLETSPDTRDEYGDPVRPHIVFSKKPCPILKKPSSWCAKRIFSSLSAHRSMCIRRQVCSTTRGQAFPSIISIRVRLRFRRASGM